MLLLVCCLNLLHWVKEKIKFVVNQYHIELHIKMRVVLITSSPLTYTDSWGEQTLHSCSLLVGPLADPAQSSKHPGWSLTLAIPPARNLDQQCATVAVGRCGLKAKERQWKQGWCWLQITKVCLISVHYFCSRKMCAESLGEGVIAGAVLSDKLPKYLQCLHTLFTCCIIHYFWNS